MEYFAVSYNRGIKAKKIEAVLCDFLGENSIKGKSILDLGCGSGHIAEYFAQHNEVIAADVMDQVTTPRKDGFTFKNITAGTLPFEDHSFDIVIFNHVMYCLPDQYRQLKDIHRILKRTGICYLATANRYFPVEGFTRLPFIHYLPNRLFRTLSKSIKKSEADLFPLGYHKIIHLIKKAGFSFHEYTGKIIRNPEKYHSEYRVPFHLPVPNCISPTVVFILRK